MVEVMVTSLMDGFGQPLMKYLRQKELLVLVVCFTAFLLGIPHVMQVRITNHCVVRHPVVTIAASVYMLKGSVCAGGDLCLPADGPLHGHSVHHVPRLFRGRGYLLDIW